MKKAVTVAVGLIAVSTVFSGCQREKVEEAIEPLVAEVLEEEQAKTGEPEEEETGLIEIDTSIPIQAGARIAVVSKNTRGEFWDMVRKGMEDAVKAVNVAYGYEKDEQITMTFEGPDDEQKVEEQINIIDAVIAENPDVLCLSVGDMNSCQAQLEAAKENGIPVVMFDSNVSDAKLIKAFRATNNVRVGEIAAYRLARVLGKMGKVAVFSAQEKTESAKNRTEGFLDMISNYTDIEVLEVVYADQVDDMEAAMQEVLEKYPKLDGVFCTNADVAEIYLDMEKDEEVHPSAMIGVDATSRQVEAIRAGEEIGVVSQEPHFMGYQTVLTAIQATVSKDKRPEIKKTVLFEPVWIELENLDDPNYSNYIYSE